MRYNVGEEVRIVADSGLHNEKYKIGDIYKITFVDFKDNKLLYELNDSFWCEEYEIISIKEIDKNTKQVNELLKILINNWIINDNDISDNIHTFGELYDYRMLYNALWVNELAKNGEYEVHKTKNHNDGEPCFGGGCFLVTVITPEGIIDNHYKLEYWDLFKCKEVEKETNEYDGHTPEDVKNRMFKLLKG